VFLYGKIGNDWNGYGVEQLQTDEEHPSVAGWTQVDDGCIAPWVAFMSEPATGKKHLLIFEEKTRRSTRGQNLVSEKTAG